MKPTREPIEKQPGAKKFVLAIGDGVASGDLVLNAVDGTLFLQAVPVGDALDEGNQDVKTRLQRAAVLAEVLDHVGALLRDDGRRPPDHHRGDDGQRDKDIGGVHSESRRSALDVGLNAECEIAHAGDAHAGTGWNRSAAVVLHGPEAAAVLRLAALSGR